MLGVRWTRAESEFLETMAGDLPLKEVVRLYQIHAADQGWPERTHRSIQQRLIRMGHGARVRTGDWVTSGGAAEILGCPSTRVEAWLRRPRVAAILQPRWIGKTRYIERRAWRQLALKMPRILGGYSVDALFALLEDRELAESVASRYRRLCGDWRVRCVETGRIYTSCGAAATAHHVTQACISQAIRQRRPVRVLGMRFEALREVG